MSRRKGAREDAVPSWPVGCQPLQSLLKGKNVATSVTTRAVATKRLDANPYAATTCGRNSVVECQLPKLDVRGSNPLARS